MTTQERGRDLALSRDRALATDAFLALAAEDLDAWAGLMDRAAALGQPGAGAVAEGLRRLRDGARGLLSLPREGGGG